MIEKSEVIHAIDDLPAIFDDAEEKVVREHYVKTIKMMPENRSKWELLEGGKARCPACHLTFNDVWDYDNQDSFCRNCGTDMRYWIYAAF